LITMLVLLPSGAGIAQVEAPADIELPPPQREGGRPLMEVIADRASFREFSGQELSTQVLSNLLWAAAGINRPEEDKRTAPSTLNWQEVALYAVTREGAFEYDAAANQLRGVAGGDLRALTGVQDFVADAPLNLLFIADVTKMRGVDPGDRALYMGADAAFMSQNAYLYCASVGLATVVRASIDREALSGALGLPETHEIVLAQTVGFPAEPAAD
jgi:hypothetical protein